MMQFPQECWVWLDPAVEPEKQKCKYNSFLPGENTYAVAQFCKKFTFEKNVIRAELRFSGDTDFRLLCNGQLVATGPFTIAGDFMCNEQPRPWHYATQTCIHPCSNELFFDARVKLTPVLINEYSRGHGGWMLGGLVYFEDGTVAEISTDSSWQARLDPRYTAPDRFNGALEMKDFHNACVVEDIWHAETAPLLPRTEEEILQNIIKVSAHSEETFDFHFDAIHAGFITLKVKTKGLLRADVICLETENISGEEHFVFAEDTSYIGLQLRSIGRYQLKVQNENDSDAEVVLSVTVTHYPVLACARTVTSDSELNAVFKQCEHALKHCRQMIHLDSPLHSEPLACTGDYYIESLMTAFSFGDLSLAAFDVVRTGEMLKYQKGVMFHTTYSLIWVLWLYDVYLFTGDRKLLEQCAEALKILLERFRGYLGENGLIETPPSYMFIDWLYIDDISLHHPPKALGQSCLNMFYYAALKKAEQIWRVLDAMEAAEECEHEEAKLRTAINLQLFDQACGLYHEGLNTDTPKELLAKYMPANVRKRYYRKHANVLAVYSGVYDGDAAKLLERILMDDSLGEYQPYFAHFVLEAVNRTGLQDKLLLPLLEPWKKAYQECPKGLQEGFIKPEPTYAFDHSHAWGGTPLYAVPLALSGLQILEPGMKKIRLNPQLLGLAWADVEIPTPYGMIRLKMQQGNETELTLPGEIELVK